MHLALCWRTQPRSSLLQPLWPWLWKQCIYIQIPDRIRNHQSSLGFHMIGRMGHGTATWKTRSTFCWSKQKPQGCDTCCIPRLLSQARIEAKVILHSIPVCRTKAPIGDCYFILRLRSTSTFACARTRNFHFSTLLHIRVSNLRSCISSEQSGLFCCDCLGALYSILKSSYESWACTTFSY